MKGKQKVNACNLFPREGESKIRGRRFKVREERFKRDLRGNFLRQRVVCILSELPEKVVKAGRITFKRRLDTHMNRKG